LPVNERHGTCIDQAGTIATDRDGRKYRCADIATHCAANPGLAALCPLTCGTCRNTRYTWDGTAISSLSWHSLDFKNLPGNVTRRPMFNSVSRSATIHAAAPPAFMLFIEANMHYGAKGAGYILRSKATSLQYTHTYRCTTFLPDLYSAQECSALNSFFFASASPVMSIVCYNSRNSTACLGQHVVLLCSATNRIIPQRVYATSSARLVLPFNIPTSVCLAVSLSAGLGDLDPHYGVTGACLHRMVGTKIP